MEEQEEKESKFSAIEQAIFFTVFMGPILFHLGFKTIVWPQAYKLESERAKPAIMQQYNQQLEVYNKVKNEIDTLQFSKAITILEKNNIHKVDYQSLILPKITLLYLSEQAAFDGFYPLDDQYRARHKEMHQWYKQIVQLESLNEEDINKWNYISRDHFKNKRFRFLFSDSQLKEDPNSKYIVTKPQFSGDFHKKIKQAILDKLDSFHDKRIIAGEQN